MQHIVVLFADGQNSLRGHSFAACLVSSGVGRKAGLSTGLTLQGSVHPELAHSGELVQPLFFFTLQNNNFKVQSVKFGMIFLSVKA